VDEEDEQEFERRTESTCNGEGIIHSRETKDRLQKSNCDADRWAQQVGMKSRKEY